MNLRFLHVLQGWICSSLGAFFLIFFLLPQSLWAADVKIVDFDGLLRAVKKVKDKATVEIVVAIKEKGTRSADLPLLTNRSGIASDIEAQPIDLTTYRFENVGDGTWRVRLRDPILRLDQVRIFE